jgi:hypothetical protein
MRVLAPWKALNTRTVTAPVPGPGRKPFGSSRNRARYRVSAAGVSSCT